MWRGKQCGPSMASSAYTKASRPCSEERSIRSSSQEVLTQSTCPRWRLGFPREPRFNLESIPASGCGWPPIGCRSSGLSGRTPDAKLHLSFYGLVEAILTRVDRPHLRPSRGQPNAHVTRVHQTGSDYQCIRATILRRRYGQPNKVGQFVHRHPLASAWS